MIDPAVLLLVVLTLTLAGTVKGVVGLGLPTVTLALLTATIGLKEAMAVMLVPSVITNVWQALVGGHFRALVGRLWTFLLALAIGTVIASGAPAMVSTSILTALLGLSIVLYGAAGLMAPPWPAPERGEAWMSPTAGAATGVLTGMTGSFVMPAVPYLQALRLPRDQLVQAMGMTFLVGTLGLAAGLGGRGLIPADLALLSAAGVLPAIFGMEIGRRIRGRLSEALFRRCLFASLLALGLWIVVKPWF